MRPFLPQPGARHGPGQRPSGRMPQSPYTDLRTLVEAAGRAHKARICVGSKTLQLSPT